MNNITNTGWLYSIWDGSFRAYEGEMLVINSERGVFKSSNKKRFTCNVEPGEMYNAVVWLRERDDEKALQILIDHNMNQRALAQETVWKYESKIEMLMHQQLRLKK